MYFIKNNYENLNLTIIQIDVALYACQWYIFEFLQFYLINAINIFYLNKNKCK